MTIIPFATPDVRTLPSVCFRAACLCCALCGFGQAVLAVQIVARDDQVTIPPGGTTVFIAHSLLLENDDLGDPPIPVDTAGYTEPLYGQLVEQPDGFLYTPAQELWELGTESFTYTLTEAGGAGGSSTATVLLIAGTGEHPRVDLDFESGLMPPDVELVGDFEIRADAAISGEKGLRVISQVPDESGFSGLWIDQGTAPTGVGHVEINIDCPDAGAAFGLSLGSAVDLVHIGDSAAPSLWLTLTRTDSDEVGVSASLSDTSVVHTVPQEGPSLLSGGPHALGLDWWNGPQSGLRLLVDGLVVGATDEAIELVLPSDAHRVGLLNPPTSSPIALDFDDLEIWIGDPSAQTRDVVRLDGFETGSADSWAGSDAPAIAVTADAAVIGSRGLAVALGSPGTRALLDPSPVALDEYNVRFLLDTHSITVPEGQDFVVLAGSSGDELPPGASHLQVRLGYAEGSYRIRALHQELGPGAQRRTQWQPISDGEHVVEVSWRAATRPDETNGRLSLRVDGEVVEHLVGLANGGYVIEAIAFGARSVDPGTYGSFHLDGFESWTKRPPPVFSDTFESGVGTWQNAQTTILTASPSAALRGLWGLLVDLDVVGQRFLIDDSPIGEKRFNVSFWLDPNAIPMAADEEFVVFAASDQDGVPDGRSHVQLRLGRVAGPSGLQYGLRIRHRDLDGGPQIVTPWTLIDDDVHVVELRWRASATDTSNGELRLWINGMLAAEITGIDNSDLVVESVRFGSKGVDAGTSGSFYLDSYRSWR